MISLRAATADDARLISYINATSWRSAYRWLLTEDFLSRLSNAYWVPSVRAWLSGGQQYGLIAMQDGRPVGCCIYGRGRDAGYDDWGEIVSLYVLPDQLRSGAGGALLHEALRLMEADGYDRVYLWTIEGNLIADSFYRKHGFRATDDRFPYRIGGKDIADLRYIR